MTGENPESAMPNTNSIMRLPHTGRPDALNQFLIGFFKCLCEEFSERASIAGQDGKNAGEGPIPQHNPDSMPDQDVDTPRMMSKKRFTRKRRGADGVILRAAETQWQCWDCGTKCSEERRWPSVSPAHAEKARRSAPVARRGTSMHKHLAPKRASVADPGQADAKARERTIGASRAEAAAQRRLAAAVRAHDGRIALRQFRQIPEAVEDFSKQTPVTK
ncbi:MAG: hypothetical protein U1E15_04400 [Hyphomicrobiales bacterium]